MLLECVIEVNEACWCEACIPRYGTNTDIYIRIEALSLLLFGTRINLEQMDTYACNEPQPALEQGGITKMSADQ